jgi:hypothetical protein
MAAYIAFWTACIKELQHMVREPVAMGSAAGDLSYEPFDAALEQLTGQPTQPQATWQQLVQKHKVG